MNLVDDAKFTRPLIRVLRGHVDAFADAMSDGTHRDLEAARPVAVAWVYHSLLVAWAEDHELIDPWLRKDAADRRENWYATDGGDPRRWLAASCASIGVHPATRCLLDPRYTHALARTPPVEVCADLIDWWSGEAPSLRYDVDSGPSSVTGWLVGDLLSALSDQRRKDHALCQTPWWVADAIIDRTLIPAAQEFTDETLRTIDPTCGTGHFLIRKLDYLWELYTTGTLHPRQATSGPVATGWIPITPIEAAKRILAGCHGVELDPLTAAVARLRYIVTLGHLLHQAGALPVLRLDALPPWQPPIVVGDSLLAGKVTAEEYAALRPEQAAIVNLGEAS